MRRNIRKNHAAARTQASAGDVERYQKEIVNLDKGEHALDELDDERPDPIASLLCMTPTSHIFRSNRSI